MLFEQVQSPEFQPKPEQYCIASASLEQVWDGKDWVDRSIEPKWYSLEDASRIYAVLSEAFAIATEHQRLSPAEMTDIMPQCLSQSRMEALNSNE